MYICIDVGGTKTLIASFDDNGIIKEQAKISTPHDYPKFLNEVRRVIDSFNDSQFSAGAVSVPAVQIDRERNIARKLPNLGWEDFDIAEGIKSITNCQIFLENDAKLAGLYEASLVKDRFSKVIYFTVSTGIGISVIENLKIYTGAGDSGGAVLPIKHDGKYMPWESFASGRAITKQYDKMAKDIEDEEAWKSISQNLAEGMILYIAIFQPQVIIIGGGVGKYFSKFDGFLRDALNQYQLPLITMPELIGAQKADEAVIYGCYDYTKQRLSNG